MKFDLPLHAGNLQVSIWAIWAGNQPPSGCVNDNRQEPY